MFSVKLAFNSAPATCKSGLWGSSLKRIQ